MNTLNTQKIPAGIARLGAGSLLGLLFLIAGHGTAFAASSSSRIILSSQSPQAPNSQVSSDLSRNWAGYVAENTNTQTGTYSSITGTWIVPTVAATNSASADATWVGVGGMSTSDLIQAGTQAITQNGQILYQAWYEVLPNASVPVSLTIKPGDSMTTTLTNQGNNEWLINILDNTTGQEYQTTVSYVSSESSAEWIEEMPADQNGYIPLDSFGAISFTQASAVTNGVSENLAGLGAKPLTMTTGMQLLATPSVLGSDGESFTVSRSSASAAVSPQTVFINRGGFTRQPHGDQGFSYASSTTQFYSVGGSGGMGGQKITRSIHYFVVPLETSGNSTTTKINVGSGQTYQYSVGNGGFSIQFSF